MYENKSPIVNKLHVPVISGIVDVTTIIHPSRSPSALEKCSPASTTSGQDDSFSSIAHLELYILLSQSFFSILPLLMFNSLYQRCVQLFSDLCSYLLVHYFSCFVSFCNILQHADFMLKTILSHPHLFAMNEVHQAPIVNV